MSQACSHYFYEEVWMRCLVVFEVTFGFRAGWAGFWGNSVMLIRITGRSAKKSLNPASYRNYHSYVTDPAALLMGRGVVAGSGEK
jgi:hypothetical protein